MPVQRKTEGQVGFRAGLPRIFKERNMFLFKTITGLQSYLDEVRAAGETIGFVPTMGALHEGHGRMIRYAVAQGHHTLVSIFVNPTQFNSQEDLQKYPRHTGKDLRYLKELGCHVVFFPEEKEIYPDAGFTPTDIDLGNLATILEGAFRPGHFEGVVQVMDRLLQITEPDYLFMGEKDLQQLAVVRKLIAETGAEIKLVGMPVVREKSGLAMSSRNERLSEAQKKRAGAVFKALEYARQNFRTTPAEVLQKQAVEMMESEGLRVEYFTIVRSDTMEITDGNPVGDDNVFAVVAVWCDEVRLIDSMSMG